MIEETVAPKKRKWYFEQRYPGGPDALKKDAKALFDRHYSAARVWEALGCSRSVLLRLFDGEFPLKTRHLKYEDTYPGGVKAFRQQVDKLHKKGYLVKDIARELGCDRRVVARNYKTEGTGSRRLFETAYRAKNGQEKLQKRIAELILENRRQEDMAKMIGCSVIVIRRNFAEAKAKYVPDDFMPIERPLKQRRVPKWARDYPGGVDAFYGHILSLRKEGKTIQEVSAELKCPPTTMAMYVRRLEETQKQTEFLAQISKKEEVYSEVYQTIMRMAAVTTPEETEAT